MRIPPLTVLLSQEEAREGDARPDPSPAREMEQPGFPISFIAILNQLITHNNDSICLFR